MNIFNKIQGTPVVHKVIKATIVLFAAFTIHTGTLSAAATPIENQQDKTSTESLEKTQKKIQIIVACIKQHEENKSDPFSNTPNFLYERLGELQALATQQMPTVMQIDHLEATINYIAAIIGKIVLDNQAIPGDLFQQYEELIEEQTKFASPRNNASPTEIEYKPGIFRNLLGAISPSEQLVWLQSEITKICIIAGKNLTKSINPSKNLFDSYRELSEIYNQQVQLALLTLENHQQTFHPYQFMQHYPSVATGISGIATQALKRVLPTSVFNVFNPTSFIENKLKPISTDFKVIGKTERIEDGKIQALKEQERKAAEEEKQLKEAEAKSLKEKKAAERKAKAEAKKKEKQRLEAEKLAAQAQAAEQKQKEKKLKAEEKHRKELEKKAVAEELAAKQKVEKEALAKAKALKAQEAEAKRKAKEEAAAKKAAPKAPQPATKPIKAKKPDAKVKTKELAKKPKNMGPAIDAELKASADLAIQIFDRYLFDGLLEITQDAIIPAVQSIEACYKLVIQLVDGNQVPAAARYYIAAKFIYHQLKINNRSEIDAIDTELIEKANNSLTSQIPQQIDKKTKPTENIMFALSALFYESTIESQDCIIDPELFVDLMNAYISKIDRSHCIGVCEKTCNGKCYIPIAIGLYAVTLGEYNVFKKCPTPIANSIEPISIAIRILYPLKSKLFKFKSGEFFAIAINKPKIKEDGIQTLIELAKEIGDQKLNPSIISKNVCIASAGFLAMYIEAQEEMPIKIKTAIKKSKTKYIDIAAKAGHQGAARILAKKTEATKKEAKAMYGKLLDQTMINMLKIPNFYTGPADKNDILRSHELADAMARILRQPEATMATLKSLAKLATEHLGFYKKYNSPHTEAIISMQQQVVQLFCKKHELDCSEINLNQTVAAHCVAYADNTSILSAEHNTAPAPQMPEEEYEKLKTPLVGDIVCTIEKLEKPAEAASENYAFYTECGNILAILSLVEAHTPDCENLQTAMKTVVSQFVKKNSPESQKIVSLFEQVLPLFCKRHGLNYTEIGLTQALAGLSEAAAVDAPILSAEQNAAPAPQRPIDPERRKRLEILMIECTNLQIEITTNKKASFEDVRRWVEVINEILSLRDCFGHDDAMQPWIYEHMRDAQAIPKYKTFELA